ncbi:DUF4189 domain-containing protein [Mycobacterium sp.]|uniref:DUF4189 domain-containing protein n=1 Tax=Mycobacterium sp. TaxID=1785 RepID=UPI0011FF2A7F|nr:DUF4189 domain-containing protein [Mycobacterium sp.]TAM63723.1 MAG: DUF4189 domain-containing protein [Mycobacterium sp.]
MLKLLAFAAMIVCAIALAAPAYAHGPYIVIVGSDSTHAFETTVGGALARPGDVEAYAVSHCDQRYDSTDCRVLAGGRGGCVALSDDGPTLVAAWAETRSSAKAAVVAKLGDPDANVDIARCIGDPGLVPPTGGSFWTTQ